MAKNSVTIGINLMLFNAVADAIPEGRYISFSTEQFRHLSDVPDTDGIKNTLSAMHLPPIDLLDTVPVIKAPGSGGMLLKAPSTILAINLESPNSLSAQFYTVTGEIQFIAQGPTKFTTLGLAPKFAENGGLNKFKPDHPNFEALAKHLNYALLRTVAAHCNLKTTDKTGKIAPSENDIGLEF